MGALALVAAIIFGLTNQCIDKFIFKKDEKSIIDNWGRKHPIIFAIATVSILSILIYNGQNMVQEFLYNKASIVKKDDVINSDYFKNLDEHKKS